METLSSVKYYILVAAISLASGAYIQRIYTPIAKSEIEVREVIKNNIITVTKEVVRADGVKESITTTTDTSVKKERSNSVIVASAPAKLWHVSLSAATKIDERDYIYGVQIEYVLIGPFSVGARVDTSKQLGLVVGFSF